MKDIQFAVITLFNLLTGPLAVCSFAYLAEGDYRAATMSGGAAVALIVWTHYMFKNRKAELEIMAVEATKANHHYHRIEDVTGQISAHPTFRKPKPQTPNQQGNPTP